MAATVHATRLGNGRGKALAVGNTAWLRRLAVAALCVAAAAGHGQPRQLAATAASATSLRVTWQVPANDARVGVDPFGRPQDLLWVLAAGSYPANAWGFHDMHGNAAEWTADCWHPDHLDAPPDSAARTDGDCSRRVARGGSYDTPAHALRSSARVGKTAGERYLDTGFRVLRELRNVEARPE